MRPLDIYALPDRYPMPWHARLPTLARMFGDPAVRLVASEDVDAAAVDGEGPLDVREVLRHITDGFGSITYLSFFWEGEPFGILVMSGRGGCENVERVISDHAGFRLARDHVRSFLPVDQAEMDDLAPATLEVPCLSGVQGHRVLAPSGGRVRLVPRLHLADGAILFDEEAFHEIFEREIRPVYAAYPSDETTGLSEERRLGIDGGRMRALAYAGMARSILGDGPRTLSFSLPAGGVEGLSRVAVLAATRDGTYAVGFEAGASVSRYLWTACIAVVRIGGRDLYGTLADAGNLHDADLVPLDARCLAGPRPRTLSVP